MNKKEVKTTKQVVHHGTVLGKELVSINVFSDSDLQLLRAWMTEDCRKTCREFDIVQRNKFSVPISRRRSTRKVLKKIAKYSAEMAVIMGRDTEEYLWRSIIYATHSANQIPSINALFAVDKGKFNLEMFLLHHLEGFRLNLRSGLYLDRKSARLRHADEEREPVSEEAETPAFQAPSDADKDGMEVLKDGNSSPDHHKKAVLLNSISIVRREVSGPCLGWPLLRRKSSPNPEFKEPEARDISVVEWVMSLPDRVTTVVNEVALHPNQTTVNSKTNANDTEKVISSSEVINDSRTSEDIHLGLEFEASVSLNRQNSESNSKPGWPLLLNKASTVSDYREEVSVSFNHKDLEPNSKPGLPLLNVTASIASDTFSENETNMAIVERKMNVPIQSKIKLQPSNFALSTEIENPVQIENNLLAQTKMPKSLELPCKKFSLKELKEATSEFSPENMIGEGGCSNVYKGRLPSGKLVAVKILKSYKEAWSDFYLEVDIVSSMKHKHIMPLIGVCLEDNHLISVYDFFAKGSLEEILHGQRKNFVVPWGLRFKIATGIAEALDYLHGECSPPIIHRDVKSSNILLSDEFQPQLSDFGLAIRGPTDSIFMIDSNVVGTFGYLAPEYFMEGRVTDKIDVYSFGVVLLELLSGRRPISSKTLEKQENLIQWARTLLERRNLQDLVDPALNGSFDAAQMRKVVLAAFLCLDHLDEERPKMSQILRILRGNEEPTQWCSFPVTELEVPKEQNADGFHKLYNYLSIPFSDDDSTSSYTNCTISRCRIGKRHRLRIRDSLQTDQN